MGMRLGELDGYPVGVSNAHPHFHQDAAHDVCPICGAPVDDSIWCEECGAVLDPEEAAAEERFADEAEGWDRGMER
jgi:predicted nucleic acid-binding Zn ribbon protein